MRVRVAHSVAQYPDSLWRTSDGVRRSGLADFLARQVARHVREQRLDRVPEARGWSGAKGGDMRVCVPGQAMLEQSAVVIDDAAIECRLTIGLPARGRTITGGLCHELLCVHLPRLVAATLCYATTPRDALRAHVDLYEDHEVLRRVLRERRLIAFVPDGSVLPRAAGNTELPMTGPGVVRFASPPSLRVSIDLPHRGRVTGMGIAEGVTLIVGGGFHGKSTLLHAIEVGVYNHVQGDGRELLVCDERAVKIRAEDGRCVHACDISAFIDNLPFGKKTTDFSTPDASGSTSQATNIVEALECGATVLLMDEDTCATNLMIRDRRMQALVAREKEPITPLIARMSAIRARGVSVVMVVGGAGDYFDVADRVIQMDAYEARDVSEQARAVAAQLPGTLALAPDSREAALQRLPARVLLPQSLAAFAEPRCRVRVPDVHAIQVGDERIDMTCVEQLVHEGQTHAIAEVLESMKLRGWIDGRATLSQLLDRIDAMRLADFAQRVLGNLVRPRRFEIAAALNRMHSLAVAQRRA